MRLIYILTLLLLTSCTANTQGHTEVSLGLSIALGATDLPVEDRLALCMGVGLVKEIVDEIDYNGFSGEDLAADLLGCAIGTIFIESIKQ